MLSNLLDVPVTANEWAIWGFSHKDHHNLIRQAIYSQSNGVDNLFEYQLDPVPFTEIDDWLSRNQQSHDDMNAILGLQGVDLEGVDVSNRQQLSAWIHTHWLEHQAAAVALRI